MIDFYSPYYYYPSPRLAIHYFEYVCMIFIYLILTCLCDHLHEISISVNVNNNMYNIYISY